MVMGPLCKLVAKVEFNGLLEGFKIGTSGPCVSLIQFTNDSFLLVGANLWKIFELYCLCLRWPLV